MKQLQVKEAQDFTKSLKFLNTNTRLNRRNPTLHLKQKQFETLQKELKMVLLITEKKFRCWLHFLTWLEEKSSYADRLQRLIYYILIRFKEESKATVGGRTRSYDRRIVGSRTDKKLESNKPCKSKKTRTGGNYITWVKFKDTT
eukprot:snap_masked-scaffold_101-processed-gene-0.32-mRNA-1 protein AED:1.00 eAED:1.00 QI:0/0/0/0/1/1/2/0/143